MSARILPAALLGPLAPSELGPPAPAPLIGSGPGCWNCPSWTRAASAIGTCGDPKGRPGALTSYVYLCPRHPKFPAEARHG